MAEQTCGITLSLMRSLHLSSSLLADKPPLDISDLVTQVDFRGPEYSLPPGIEGVASLVVDIPRHSRGSRGHPRLDNSGKSTDSLFDIRCSFNIRVEMPPGRCVLNCTTVMVKFSWRLRQRGCSINFTRDGLPFDRCSRSPCITTIHHGISALGAIHFSSGYIFAFYSGTFTISHYQSRCTSLAPASGTTYLRSTPQ